MYAVQVWARWEGEGKRERERERERASERARETSPWNGMRGGGRVAEEPE
jgi:hypothetical protein